jgi:thymidylate kinase
MIEVGVKSEKHVSGELPVLISFSGMDGSGKSTQIELLRSALIDAGLTIERLAFWDDVVAFSKYRAQLSHKFLKSEGGIGAPGKPVKRNDKNNRAWYLTAGRYFLYFLDACKLNRKVREARKHARDVIVFDRYIYDQLATLPLEGLVARTYARVLMWVVPRPTTAYLLDAEPEIARQRKPEYPLAFLHLYRRSYLTLQKLARLTLIPSRSQEEVHALILQALPKSEYHNMSTGISLDSVQP